MKIDLTDLPALYPGYTIFIVPNNEKFVLKMFKEGAIATSYERRNLAGYNNNYNYYLPNGEANTIGETNQMVFI